MSIRQRGKGCWEITVELGRDPVTGRRLRNYPNVKGTQRDALAEERRLLRERDLGTYVSPTRFTTAEYLSQWLAHIDGSDRRARTKEGYRSIVDGHLVPGLGTIPLAKLQPLHIENYYKAQRAGQNPKKRKLSGLTLLHHHEVLRAALNQAVRWRLIAMNPVALVDAPGAERREPEILDSAETAKLLKAMSDLDPSMRVAVLLVAAGGLRRGEVLGLPWANVDLDKGEMRVERTLQCLKGGALAFQPPKTKQSRRTIALPTFAIEALRNHHRHQSETRLLLGSGYQDNDLVCCRPDGRPWIPGSFSSAFGSSLKKLGYANLRFHDLRHCHATQLINLGVDVQSVSMRLGHSTATTTLNVYSHAVRNGDRLTAEAINIHLGGKIEELGRG